MSAVGGTAFGDVAARLAAVRRRIAAAGGRSVERAGRRRDEGPPGGRRGGGRGGGLSRARRKLRRRARRQGGAGCGRRPPALPCAGTSSAASSGAASARLAPFVGLYETVDRLEEGVALARHRPGAAVLVEVDTTGLPGRGGVAADEAPRLVEDLAALGLDVQGLMTVAAPGDDDRARRSFAAVSSLVAELGLREASMGMSDDFELAVAEGSTMIRVGRALFGPRPTRTAIPE